ncbi:hypothetical protein F6455_01150 [Proteobacteria bacterium 005FR1]|nr:hypothetical protein [Proteobacteria bacterium 005FR1]
MIKLPFKLLLTLVAIVAAGALWQRTELAFLAMNRIDPVPETRSLVDQERYAEAADHLDFFMEYDYVRSDPEAQTLYRQIAAVRNSWSYQASKVSEGLLTGTSDETSGMTAAVASDFFVFGDIRDLAIQAMKKSRGEETDEVLVALASLGLAASAVQIVSASGTAATGGAAAPVLLGSTAVKGGIIASKAARKVGKLPPWLARSLVQGSKAAGESRSVGNVAGVLRDVNTLATTRGGLTLLGKTTDAKSLRRMSGFARQFGNQSTTLYRVGGDLAVDMSKQVPTFGKHSIKLASTYGGEGLKLLNKTGAPAFVKYSARVSKIAYKGDALRLMASYLLRVPEWLLATLITFGILQWIPGRRLFRRQGRLS